MAGMLRIRGASQIVQVCKNGEKVLKGGSMKDIAVIEGNVGRGVGLIVNEEGIIVALDYDDILDFRYSEWTFDRVIDANGSSIIPGLIDSHTHPVWTGDRVHEFRLKLAGASYMDIHKLGGGIHYTVNCVQQSTAEELYKSLHDRLCCMVRYGTTTAEVKTGYGLNTATEIKMLEVLKRAKSVHPMSLSITYCGAHAVPKGRSSEEATEYIVSEQIPAISQLCLSGDLHVDNIDVFCEKNVFNYQQSKRILTAGKKEGWAINFHGDELSLMHSGELAGELKAAAVSHLEEVSDRGIAAMVDSGTVGVLLPTTAYILHLTPPPARRMIDKGMAVALGSDFNPNAFCMSMPLVMHLACVMLGMTMEEALVASTINSAAALGLSRLRGSLEVGKKADILILTEDKWEHIIYQLGSVDRCIQYVIKDGRIIHESSR